MVNGHVSDISASSLARREARRQWQWQQQQQHWPKTTTKIEPQQYILLIAVSVVSGMCIYLTSHVIERILLYRPHASLLLTDFVFLMIWPSRMASAATGIRHGRRSRPTWQSSLLLDLALASLYHAPRTVHLETGKGRHDS